MCSRYCYLGTSGAKADGMGEGSVPGRSHRVLLHYIKTALQFHFSSVLSSFLRSSRMLILNILHGISQARILEWIAISFSSGIFLTQIASPAYISCLAGRFFTTEPPGKPQLTIIYLSFKSTFPKQKIRLDGI